jgi:hypothetical protein
VVVLSENVQGLVVIDANIFHAKFLGGAQQLTSSTTKNISKHKHTSQTHRLKTCAPVL